MRISGSFLIGITFIFMSFVIYAAAEYDLLKAIEKGDAWDVEDSISEGDSVQQKDKFGRTPLHKAAHRGDKEIVETLIENGADVNAADINGETPLHAAAWNEQTEIITFLVSKKADPKLKNKNGQTAEDITAKLKSTKTAISNEQNENDVENINDVNDYKSIKNRMEKRRPGIEGYNLTTGIYINTARDRVLKFDEDMNVYYHNGKKGDWKGTYDITGEEVKVKIRRKNSIILRIVDERTLVDTKTHVVYALMEGGASAE